MLRYFLPTSINNPIFNGGLTRLCMALSGAASNHRDVHGLLDQYVTMSVYTHLFVLFARRDCLKSVTGRNRESVR